MTTKQTATLKIDIWMDGRKRLPRDTSELAEQFVPHLEHVRELCAKGCQSGDIIDACFSGWWTIERGDQS